jgi:hypothetical protein
VRVVQLRHQYNLPLQPLGAVRRQTRLVNNLDRDLPTRPGPLRR